MLNAGYTEDVRKTAFDDVDKILKAAKADLDARCLLAVEGGCPSREVRNY